MLYQILFIPALFFRTFRWWRESGFSQSVAQTVPTLTTLLLHFANNAVTHAGRRPAFQILDLAAIDDRLEALRKVKSDKPYQKQKSSLQHELERFLRSLASLKSLKSATPQDLTRFLIWKDKGGKTKIHLPQCKHFGVSGKARCLCPTRLAAGTVDNLIGKLRFIFIEAGRGDAWNDILGVGNPAAHHSVKQYLALVREEQAKARVCKN